MNLYNSKYLINRENLFSSQELKKGDDILVRKKDNTTYSKTKIESINHADESICYFNENDKLKE